MLDFLRPNRLRNIFDPMLNSGMSDMGMPDINMGTSPTFPNASPINPDMIEQQPDETLYAQPELPSHPAADRLTQLLGEMPQRQPASAMRKIGNLIVSAAQGPQAAGQLFDAPYQQNLQDWATKLKPAEYAANLERQQETTSLAARKQAETERKNLETEAINRSKVELSRFKLEHPDWKIDYSGPNPIAVNPQNPQQHTILKDVSTGHLSDADKITQSSTAKIEQIHAAGGEARATEQVKGENRQELAWSDPYQVDMPDGTKKYFQTNKASGEVRETQFPGVASKIGTSGGATGDKLKAVQDMASSALTSLNELYDDKGNLSPRTKSILGARGYDPRQYIKGTDQYTASLAINNLKSKLVLELMGELKSQSRTGATGFGNLQRAELRILEDAASKLDPNQDPVEFEKQLKLVKEKLEKILQPTGSGNPTTIGGSSTVIRPGMVDGQPITSPIPGKKLTPEEIYNNYLKKIQGGR